MYPIPLPRACSLRDPTFSDKQHIRNCFCLDDLFPHAAMVDFILRPEPGVEKKVLDIG